MKLYQQNYAIQFDDKKMFRLYFPNAITIGLFSNSKFGLFCNREKMIALLETT
jgi:hypothetical protein